VKSFFVFFGALVALGGTDKSEKCKTQPKETPLTLIWLSQSSLTNL
jgi:hypothetical protein